MIILQPADNQLVEITVFLIKFSVKCRSLFIVTTRRAPLASSKMSCAEEEKAYFIKSCSTALYMIMCGHEPNTLISGLCDLKPRGAWRYDYS